MVAGVRSLFFVGTAGVLSDGHKLERVRRKDVATSRLESLSLVAIRLLALLCQHKMNSIVIYLSIIVQLRPVVLFPVEFSSILQ